MSCSQSVHDIYDGDMIGNMPPDTLLQCHPHWKEDHTISHGHFNVMPRVAANLFMEWRYDWKYDTCNHLTHIAHHPCLWPGCILMAVHELQHICEWSGDMIEMLKRTSRNL